MGWHRTGTIQEPNTPARSKKAQSPPWRGDVCTQVCAQRGVHSGVCACRCMITGVCAHRGVHSGVCSGVSAKVCAHRCVLTGVCTQGYVLRCMRKGLRGFANKRALLVCKQNQWSETSCGRAQGLCLDQGAVTSWRPCWSGLTVKVILQAGCRALHRWSPGRSTVRGRARAESVGRQRSQQDSAGSTSAERRLGAHVVGVGHGWCSQAGCSHRMPLLFLGQAPCLQSGHHHSDPSQPEVSPVRGLAVGQASLVPLPASTSPHQPPADPGAPTISQDGSPSRSILHHHRP